MLFVICRDINLVVKLAFNQILPLRMLLRSLRTSCAVKHVIRPMRSIFVLMTSVELVDIILKDKLRCRYRNHLTIDTAEMEVFSFFPISLPFLPDLIQSFFSHSLTLSLIKVSMGLVRKSQDAKGGNLSKRYGQRS